MSRVIKFCGLFLVAFRTISGRNYGGNGLTVVLKGIHLFRISLMALKAAYSAGRMLAFLPHLHNTNPLPLLGVAVDTGLALFGDVGHITAFLCL